MESKDERITETIDPCLLTDVSWMDIHECYGGGGSGQKKREHTNVNLFLFLNPYCAHYVFYGTSTKLILFFAGPQDLSALRSKKG